MATPSQATNGLLLAVQALSPESAEAEWKAVLVTLSEQRSAWTANRDELRERVAARGPDFATAAASRVGAVEEAYARYGEALDALAQACSERRCSLLETCCQRLADDTVALYAALDQFASFHFNWNQGQSPLVTVIRQAVESYSRNALQSAQAQRILQDMHTHLGTTKEIRVQREEGPA